VNAADLRSFMSPIDRDALPTVQEARADQRAGYYGITFVEHPSVEVAADDRAMQTNVGISDHPPILVFSAAMPAGERLRSESMLGS
jgi:hypothetical protein